MRVAITGSQGQIGSEMVRAMSEDVRFQRDQIMGVDRLQMEMSDAAAVRQVLRDLKPDLIINAAGYTAVDRAELPEQAPLARAINSIAVGVIGEEARRIGAALIHYSTDYIFDGTKTSPYVPDDAPNPKSVYGQTKLEGERALLESGAAALILRTSWVYSLRRRNFLLAIFRQAMNKPELRVVNDQTGCPTSSRAIADATVQIIANSLKPNEDGAWTFDGREGVYHLVASGFATWFEFAEAAIEMANIHPRPHLVPVSSEEFAAAAPRPKYSVLDCATTTRAFGVIMPNWRVQLQDVLCRGDWQAAVAEK